MLLVAGEPEESAQAAARLAVLDAPSWRAVEPAVVALLGKVRGDSRQEVVELLTERGVLDRARLDLRARSAVRRCAAAELLGRAEDPTAVRVLVRLLDDADPDVRRVTARALGRIGAPAAAAPLLAALGAGPQRAPAPVPAPVVAQLGEPRACPLLCALLDDDDERVAAAAGPALLALGGRGRALLGRVAADTRGDLARAPALARETLATARLQRPAPAGAR